MEAANFMNVYSYADVWVAMDFEGVTFPGPNTFNENTYMQMRHY
jgi:hypothetical protein